MSWFNREPKHLHKWADVSKANVTLPTHKVIYEKVDDYWDEEEREYQVVNVPCISVFQKCETCGDVRTVNLEGTIP